MATKKCLSYINKEYCEEITNGQNWCVYCSKILLPSYLKYKKLESRYENIDDLNCLSFMKLLKTHSRIGHVIDLRRYIAENGFSPEMRDQGHEEKIKMLIKMQKEIEEILSTKQNISETEQEESEESEESEEECPKKPERQKPEKSPSAKRQNQKNEEGPVDYLNIICDITLASLITECQKFLASKFGENFLRAFILQQKTLNCLCQHGADIAREKFANKYRSGNALPKNLSYKISINNISHRFVTYGEILFEIAKTPFWLAESSFDSGNTTALNKAFNEFDTMHMILILYDHIPQIPLPIHIISIRQSLDEESEKLLRETEISEEIIDGYRDVVESKISLLKTRRAKNVVCFNNCVRTSRLGNPKPDEEFITSLLPVAKKNFVKMVTSIRKTSGDLVSEGDPDLLDMENFRCICSQSAIIKLQRSYFKGITEFDKFLQILTVKTPYIFV